MDDVDQTRMGYDEYENEEGNAYLNESYSHWVKVKGVMKEEIVPKIPYLKLNGEIVNQITANDKENREIL